MYSDSLYALIFPTQENHILDDQLQTLGIDYHIA